LVQIAHAKTVISKTHPPQLNACSAIVHAKPALTPPQPASPATPILSATSITQPVPVFSATMTTEPSHAFYAPISVKPVLVLLQVFAHLAHPHIIEHCKMEPAHAASGTMIVVLSPARHATKPVLDVSHLLKFAPNAIQIKTVN
jgi:hypothetical protein